MSVYQEYVAKRDQLEATITKVTRVYESEMGHLKSELRQVNAVLNVAENGVDPEQFMVARQVLEVHWSKNSYEQRRNCDEVKKAIDDAIEELRHGGRKLHTRQVSIKAYDRWAAQRTDSDYGYGPTHGSDWFKIGLTPAVRAKGPLDEPVALACILWLNALKRDPDLLTLAGM